jgi:hypothetical protein
VERVIETLRRELWDATEFFDRRDAEQQLGAFFAAYNEKRAQMDIDGLTPADRFFGRATRPCPPSMTSVAGVRGPPRRSRRRALPSRSWAPWCRVHHSRCRGS